nr:MAG TPA: contryphan [Caudoviricetes sp.]
MEAFWEDDIMIETTWGNLVFTRCSHCKNAPLESEEEGVLSPYRPWCGCKMTNAEEE